MQRSGVVCTPAPSSETYDKNVRTAEKEAGALRGYQDASDYGTPSS